MFKSAAVKKIVPAVFIAGVLFILGVYLVMNSLQENGPALADASAQAPGKFIALPDGTTHYVLTGDDTAKLVVLVTGGGITGMEVWKNNIHAIENKGFRVLAYDLYGRGYSARPEGAITPEMLTRQLKTLLDSLHVTKPFDMIAMSFGAIIALDFNKLYPGSIDKLVLLDPTATGEYRISKLLTMPVVKPLVMTIYWHPRAIENQRKEFVNQEMFNEYTERLRYFMAFKGYKKMTLDTWNYVLNQNRLSLLANFPPNKVLVLYGDRDPYFPAGNIPLFEKIYPTLKSTVIRDAGHMPQYEQAAAVNPIVLDFLEAD